MDYAELSTAFKHNPYYTEETEPEQQPEEVVMEPVMNVVERPSMCEEYQSHINSCRGCMYTQERKRSNLVNLLLIFGLFWLIFRKN